MSCGDTSHRCERACSIASPCVRKLFPDDLARHFGGQGPIILGKRGAQRLVDEGLVAAPGRFCFGTESFDDIVIDPDRDACLAGGAGRALLAATWAKTAGGMDYKWVEKVRLTESSEVYIINIYLQKTKVHS